jgi:hypothetical protein
MRAQRVSRSGYRGVCETCVSLSRVLRAWCEGIGRFAKRRSSLVLVVRVFVDKSATITCSLLGFGSTLSATSTVTRPSLDFTHDSTYSDA